MLGYTCYLWDFDGTLFDSYPHTIEAMYTIARAAGKDFSRQQLSDALHIHFGKGYELVQFDDDQMKAFHALRDRRDFEPRVVPFEGAKAALETLKAHGAMHVLYTHSNNHMSVDYLKEFDMDGLFDLFVTADMHFPAKPAPDAVEYIVRELHLDKAKTVMVGDREIDVLSAYNAGVDGILFNCYYPDQPTCARYCVRTFAEIPLLEG